MTFRLLRSRLGRNNRKVPARLGNSLKKRWRTVEPLPHTLQGILLAIVVLLAIGKAPTMRGLEKTLDRLASLTRKTSNQASDMVEGFLGNEAHDGKIVSREQEHGPEPSGMVRLSRSAHKAIETETQSSSRKRKMRKRRVKPRKRSPFSRYNSSSVPPELIHWARGLIDKGNCESRSNSLITRCCEAHCGGMSDRLRGLATLLLAAEQAGRKLCITKDYFIPSNKPTLCDDGRYVYITHDTIIDYPSDWKHMKRDQRPPPRRTNMADRENPVGENPASEARYISSARTVNIPRLNVGGRQDNKKLGVMALDLSGVLAADTKFAQRSLARLIGKPIDSMPHVAFHVRCGASIFTNREGEHIKATDRWVDGYGTSAPDLILKSLRSLRRTIRCKKPLYLASDSLRYRDEMIRALPKGIRTIVCCSEPLHIGFTYDGASGSNISNVSRYAETQHLVDLEALGTADKIFKAIGGFAEVGAVAKSWDPKPVVVWPGAGERDEEPSMRERNKFIGELLESLECTTSHRTRSRKLSRWKRTV